MHWKDEKHRSARNNAEEEERTREKRVGSPKPNRHHSQLFLAEWGAKSQCFEPLIDQYERPFELLCFIRLKILIIRVQTWSSSSQKEKFSRVQIRRARRKNSKWENGSTTLSNLGEEDKKKKKKKTDLRRKIWRIIIVTRRPQGLDFLSINGWNLSFSSSWSISSLISTYSTWRLDREPNSMRKRRNRNGVSWNRREIERERETIPSLSHVCKKKRTLKHHTLSV